MVENLEYRDGVWFLPPSSDVPAPSPERRGRPRRWRSGEVSLSRLEGAWHCHAKQPPKGKPGCRTIGRILTDLVEEVGGIDSLPPAIYVESNHQLSARSLVTLHMVANIDWRNDLFHSLHQQEVPADPRELALKYENRVVCAVAEELADYTQLPSAALKLGRRKSDIGSAEPKTDGLFDNAGRNHLHIVEAKMRQPSFEEGYSQLMQYYGLSRFSPVFSSRRVTTTLRCSDLRLQPADAMLLDFVRSSRQMQIYVPFPPKSVE